MSLQALDDLKSRARTRRDTDGDREDRCDECGNPVTVSLTDDSTEYGHAGGCSQRPDDLGGAPRGGPA